MEKKRWKQVRDVCIKNLAHAKEKAEAEAEKIKESKVVLSALLKSIIFLGQTEFLKGRLQRILAFYEWKSMKNGIVLNPFG